MRLVAAGDGGGVSVLVNSFSAASEILVTARLSSSVSSVLVMLDW